jgi:acyl-CoA oxidase
MGVQYSLWGGSILNLGTERHRKMYFEDIDKFRLPGKPMSCFSPPLQDHAERLACACGLLLAETMDISGRAKH